MRPIFKPSAQMTFVTANEDQKRLLQFLQTMTTSSYIFDLSQVVEFDSAGLAFLIEAKKLSLDRKIACHYEGLSDNIKTFVRFFGVETLIAG